MILLGAHLEMWVQSFWPRTLGLKFSNRKSIVICHKNSTPQCQQTWKASFFSVPRVAFHTTPNQVGLRYGIWTPGSSPSSRSSTNERNQLIGWPRFEACRRWGCGDPNYGLSEEALQVSWMLRERFLPCMCGAHFESGQQLVTELLFSLPSAEQLTPACDRFRPFVETGDLECAAAVVSSSLLCASAAAGAEPLLARAFLARALQAILAGSMLVCYEGMWMVQVDEILDQFYRLHTPEFAYARLNWTRHNHSSEDGSMLTGMCYTLAV